MNFLVISSIFSAFLYFELTMAGVRKAIFSEFLYFELTMAGVRKANF